MDRFYVGPVIVKGPLLIRRHDRFARGVDDQRRARDTVACGLPLNDVNLRQATLCTSLKFRVRLS